MSDVREQLKAVIVETRKGESAGRHVWSYDIADAILKRWDLTPKPAADERKVGGMVSMALLNAGMIEGYNDEDKFLLPIGRKMLDQLANAGLTIVRIEEAGE